MRWVLIHTRNKQQFLKNKKTQKLEIIYSIYSCFSGKMSDGYSVAKSGKLKLKGNIYKL